MSRSRDSQSGQMALPLTSRPKPAWTPASDDGASLEAASHVAKTGRAARVRRQVLAAIAASPATDQQLEERLNVAGNTIRPRRKELLDDGLVEHAGEFRSLPSGRKAKVYQATPAGRAALREESLPARRRTAEHPDGGARG